jgi:hypothetical protein
VEAAPNPVKLLETEAKAALEQRLTKQITADYGGQIDEKDLLDCVHSLRYAKTTTGETRVFCQDRLVSTRKNDPLPRQARDTYTRGTKIKLKRLRLFLSRSVHVYTSPAEQQQALLADIDADPKQRFGTDGTNARRNEETRLD